MCTTGEDENGPCAYTSMFDVDAFNSVPLLKMCHSELAYVYTAPSAG